MTNTLPILEQIAAASGHHLSNFEIGALVALPTTVATHFWAFIKFYAHVGGFDGIKRFIKTGSIAKV